MNRLLKILLLVALPCSLLAGCGMGQKKNDVTLIVKCPTLVMNSVLDSDIVDAQSFLERAGESFTQQYKEANVTIDVQVFDLVDEADAVSGTFDTEDAMDVLYEDYFNMAAYVHTGRVVSLDDMITEEIREDISDTDWKISSVDDKTYMMPYLSRQNIWIYNKDLMVSCGLEEYVSQDMEIQNWSIEDWTLILDTLADQLPKGVYPMAMYGKNNQGDTHIMSLIRGFGSEIFDDEGNFNFEDQKAIEALTWIQDGVEKGWYPPHSENLEIADNQELFNNDQLVFYLFNNANTGLYDDLSRYGFVNFPGNIATSFYTGFEVFDNGDETKIQVAKDFIQYIYETDDLLKLSVGNIPASKKMAEEYEDQILMLEDYMENEACVVDFMNSSPNWQGNSTSVRSVFWPNIHNLLLGTMTPEECARSLDEECNRSLEIGRLSSVLHE